MNGIPKVALLVETSRGFGRDLLRGIVRYSRLHGPWAFYIIPGDLEQKLPRMEQWGGTGIIARVETASVAKSITESGLPTIALDLTDRQMLPSNPLFRCSTVSPDPHLAAMMAAEHLLERGFRHYAFVGIEGRVWSDRRKESFIKLITAAGFRPHVYKPPRLRRDRVWEREQAILADWLDALPKPVALMACNDDRGREVLEACRLAKILVPEQISVIGVDNDELLCELAFPPLSSVALNAEQGGYRAAKLLDQMMRGRIKKPRHLLVEPLHVVARRSTNMVALDDINVANALRFILEQSTHPLSVNDVVRHIRTSRRWLEIRFQKAIGHTIHEEIQRVRLERVKGLLLESDMSTAEIAFTTGFGTPSYMCQAFKRQTGVTPAKYRAKFRVK